jgi:hypothetical protein
MSLSLETMRRMMRASTGLPNNISETEIRHYASEVLKRLSSAKIPVPWPR